MIDKGDCWFDEKMKPTDMFNKKSEHVGTHYCPYIPKFLFTDGQNAEIVKTGNWPFPHTGWPENVEKA